MRARGREIASLGKPAALVKNRAIRPAASYLCISPPRFELALPMMSYTLTQPGSKPAGRRFRTTRTFGFQRTKSRVLARWRALERRAEFQEARAFFLPPSLSVSLPPAPIRSGERTDSYGSDAVLWRRLFRFNSRFTPSRSTRPVL